MFRINPRPIHIFDALDILVPPQAFVHAKIYHRIPKSGLCNGARLHSLIAKFAGEARIALQVVILKITKKAAEIFRRGHGSVGVAHEKVYRLKAPEFLRF